MSKIPEFAPTREYKLRKRFDKWWTGGPVKAEPVGVDMGSKARKTVAAKLLKQRQHERKRGGTR